MLRQDSAMDATLSAVPNLVKRKEDKRKTPGMARRPIDAPIGQAEKLKAGIQVKVGHPFHVSKRQFGRMEKS